MALRYIPAQQTNSSYAEVLRWLGRYQVFKREDSEWSRFSKALSNQPKAPAEEAPTSEPTPEPAAVQREVAPPAPTPPPAPPRPTAPQSYTRPQVPTPQVEVEDFETVVGPKSFFDGTLRCESSMRIKGTASGEITCSKSLIIEESATVNARVTSANATVAGKLDGSIVCEGRLEILATGRVTGELSAGVLVIQEGAFFEGHLKMKDRKPGDGSSEAAPAGRKFGSDHGESVVN